LPRQIKLMGSKITLDTIDFFFIVWTKNKQNKPPRHCSKYNLLCSTEDKMSYKQNSHPKS